MQDGFFYLKNVFVELADNPHINCPFPGNGEGRGGPIWLANWWGWIRNGTNNINHNGCNNENICLPLVLVEQRYILTE